MQHFDERFRTLEAKHKMLSEAMADIKKAIEDMERWNVAES